MKSLRGYMANYSDMSYADVPMEHLNYEDETAPKNYLERIRELIENGDVGGYVSAFDRGFSGGFGRKVGGFINAVGSYPVDRMAEWLGYENVPTFSDRYNEIVQQADMNEEQLRQQHPYAAAGTEMLGNIFGLGNAAYGLAGRMGLKGVAQLGAAGAIDAATNTFGQADNINDALYNLPQNTAYGAVGGAVMGKLGEYGGYYGNKLLDWGQNRWRTAMNNRMQTAMNQSVGHRIDIPQAVAGRQQAYDKYIAQNANREVVDFMPREPIKGSSLYENVMPDHTPVEMVNIDAIPNFQGKAQLREWLKDKFTGSNMNITSSGEDVNFNNSIAGRIIKNSRSKINNLAYPQLDEVVSKGYFSGMRPTDARHINKVQGQNVYHSGVMYNGNPYSVEFYVDQPLGASRTHNYAGQNIKRMKQVARDTGLTPSANGSELPQQLASEYNLASLRGNVNENLLNVSGLYNGLTPSQVGLMDNALRQGLGQSAYKAGTLDSLDKIRRAAYQQNGTLTDLSAVQGRINNVMTPYTGRLDNRLAQAKRMEQYYKQGYMNQPVARSTGNQQFHSNVEKQAYL